MASSAQDRRSRRESQQAHRLAEARKQRRNKILFTIAGMLVLACVIGIAIWGFLTAGPKEPNPTSTGTGTATGETNLPPNAVGNHGIAMAEMNQDIPTLEIISDYNCGACRAAHLTLNTALNEYVEAGKINVVITSVNYQGGYSLTAAVGAACADFQGAFPAYNHEVFLANEEGLTKELIRDTVPAKLGLSDEQLENFQTCVDNENTAGFVNSQTDYALAKGLNVTPRFLLDGDNVSDKIIHPTTGAFDVDRLRELLDSQ
ncbi:MAG: DsbA family protein [Propionibacteriaceae bacterium]|nr:DsbA family protein [Propionibacteriaceae bacterium]